MISLQSQQKDHKSIRPAKEVTMDPAHCNRLCRQAADLTITSELTTCTYRLILQTDNYQTNLIYKSVTKYVITSAIIDNHIEHATASMMQTKASGMAETIENNTRKG